MKPIQTFHCLSVLCVFVLMNSLLYKCPTSNNSLCSPQPIPEAVSYLPVMNIFFCSFHLNTNERAKIHYIWDSRAGCMCLKLVHSHRIEITHWLIAGLPIPILCPTLQPLVTRKSFCVQRFSLKCQQYSTSSCNLRRFKSPLNLNSRGKNRKVSLW